jgi:hypothetical protein
LHKRPHRERLVLVDDVFDFPSLSLRAIDSHFRAAIHALFQSLQAIENG